LKVNKLSHIFFLLNPIPTANANFHEFFAGGPPPPLPPPTTFSGTRRIVTHCVITEK
jgi:hypothetical protein